MKPIGSFNSNLSTAILLTGGAGTGKTVLAMRLFPRTYVYVADLNFQSGIDYLKRIGKTENIVGYDMAGVGDDGKKLIPMLRFDRMMEKLTAASMDTTIDCIVLDSASFIEDIIKAHICKASVEGNIRLDGFKQWGDLVICWKSLIYQLRQSGKKLIMVAHEQKERDESDMIYKYQIAVDGSIRAKLPVLFSDVWRCEVQENQGVHSWNIRLLGNVRQEHLKRSSAYSQFPAVMAQDTFVRQLEASASTPAVVPAQQKQPIETTK